jgi:predicted HTH transcriptional regulator
VPNVRFDGSGLWTEFAFADGYLHNIQAKTPMKTLPKTPESILSLRREHPTLTATAVAATLGKSRSSILRAIRKLREEGRLRYVGP